MTTTYDPTHPRYRDEADVRGELTRAFDTCAGCRRCVDLCGVFPTLFEMLDRHEERDAGLLTPAQQDRVVGECLHCMLCPIDCPFAPGRDESQLDVARLMLRADAMRFANGHVPARERAATRFAGRTDLAGRVATAAAPIANGLVAAAPGSLRRRAVAAVTGLSAERVLPPFTRQRFSTWFRRRPRPAGGEQPQASVTIFPTCSVEYHEPGIGRDLVRVCERNGIECAMSAAGCCGAPSLHGGDVERFTAMARRNVRTLAAEVRRGTTIVVPQPTCGQVLRTEYPAHVGGPDAELVAAHTHDAAEHLMTVHRSAGTELDIGFAGDVPSRLTYHVSCHLRCQGIGVPGRDLLELTGAEVRVVEQCAGIDGAWGLRSGNESTAVPIAARLGARLAAEEGGAAGVVVGDCHLANTAIFEQTGSRPMHPIQVLARAYGIAEEP